jgi:general secretion pathway protein D
VSVPGWRRAAALVFVGLLAAGCAAKIAYRQGQNEARKGNWDLAVARLSRALQRDPDNIAYKISLENARAQASRQHYAEARRRLAADDLAKAADELDIAVKYDPGNKAATEDLTIVRERIERREEERQRQSQFDAMKTRAQAAPLPVPVLSPRSTAPITLKFTDTSLEKIFETLSRLSGVNILFDQEFRDKRTSVNLTGVSFEDALDRIAFVNRLFYKVLDPNTIIIVPEAPAKRRAYEDVLLRTFYLQNAETKDIDPLLKLSLSPNARVGSNATLGAITIIATPDELALAARIIESNDKSRGEVLVEVEILEVNRSKMRNYGIALANYGVRATFAPTGAAGELSTDGFTNLRAHVLSSLNLSDFVVSVPSSVFAQFLQNDNTARIIATPRLRAAEGKKTTLKIGTEVPIPVTTFTATQAGSTTFAPATSFNYRNVGVTLELTPRVTPAGDIALELNAEFSSIGANVNVGTGQNPLNVPTFLTRSVNGVLRVRDGETSLIGGLVQGREATTLSGFLFLQDIPILNKIFPATTRQKDDTEILISLTPHLVRAPRVRDEDLASLFVGMRDLVKVPGARPPLFGPPEAAPSPAGPAATTVAPLPAPTAEPTPIPPLGPAPTSPRTPSPPPPPSVSAPAGSPAEPIAAPTPTPPPPTPSPVPLEAPPTPTPAPAPVPGGASARLSPADATVHAGLTTTVSVVVMAAQDVNSVDLVLAYDPAIVEAVDVGSGPLLTLDGTPVGVEKGMEPGRLRARFTRTRGTSGSGVIATVTFRAVRAGTSPLTPEALSLGTTAGPMAVPFAGVGRITVTP